MNALKTGIDAQSQIITGEDPEGLERLTARYYDRFQPQGPEEVALIDDAVSSDWLLRLLRKTEAEMWNGSTAEHSSNLFKWGQKTEANPLAAAFRDQQKVFERLQRRISAAERSLRASLETLARLRKQGGTGLLACHVPAVGQALSPDEVGQALSPANDTPPPTPSKQTDNTEIGFVPETSPVGQTPLVAPAVLPPVKPQRPPARVHLDPPQPPDPAVPDTL